VNGNVKLGRAAARSGEWAQHFSNVYCIAIRNRVGRESSFERLFGTSSLCVIHAMYTQLPPTLETSRSRDPVAAGSHAAGSPAWIAQ